jgi:hypothetical protein
MMILVWILALVSSALFTKYWYSLGGTKIEAALLFISMTLSIVGIGQLLLS